MCMCVCLCACGCVRRILFYPYIISFYFRTLLSSDQLGSKFIPLVSRTPTPLHTHSLVHFHQSRLAHACFFNFLLIKESSVRGRYQGRTLPPPCAQSLPTRTHSPCMYTLARALVSECGWVGNRMRTRKERHEVAGGCMKRKKHEMLLYT